MGTADFLRIVTAPRIQLNSRVEPTLRQWGNNENKIIIITGWDLQLQTKAEARDARRGRGVFPLEAAGRAAPCFHGGSLLVPAGSTGYSRRTGTKQLPAHFLKSSVQGLTQLNEK